jgi:hypothetical protein
MNIGALQNMVPGDFVNVSANAVYNSEHVVAAYRIIVTYEITGTDAANYIKPVDYITAGSITRAAPDITSWPGPMSAVHGTFLFNVTIPDNGINSTPGIFTWTNPGNLVGNVGWQVHSMTFTPIDSGNFNSMVEPNISIEVSPSLITSIEVSVTPPSTGAMPDLNVIYNGNFSFTTVEWVTGTQVHNETELFHGGTVYFIRLQAIPSANYAFNIVGNSVKVNGNDATVTINQANQITFSYTFPVTDLRAVAGITISRQPNLEYTHRNNLDLSDLEVMFIYNDQTTHNVTFANFGANSITTVPANNVTLSRSLHDGFSIEVRHDVGFSIWIAYTDPLIIEQANGQSVTVPVVNSVHRVSDDDNNYYNSLVIRGVNVQGSNPGEQNAEYAISNTVDVPVSGWRTDTTFNYLIAGETYYVHARSAANFNYFAGTPTRSSAIRFFTVDFDANGATGDVPETQIVLSGRPVTIPAAGNLTRTNYEFGSWNTNAGGTGTNYAQGQSFTPAENLILYARWLARQIFEFSIDPLQDFSPTIPISITISRSGFGDNPQFGNLTVTNASDFPGGITWFSGSNEIGTGSELTVNATDIRFNIIGRHNVTAIGIINDIPYSRIVRFEVIP